MTAHIHAFITVRTGSSRLPNKCHLPFYDTTVLRHVIKRAKAFGLTPVITTTTEAEDNDIAFVAAHDNVLCYRGPVEDKLLRWKETCDAFNIKRFVTVDCDDPYFDGELTKLSFATLEHVDAVAPNMNAYLGSHGWSLRKTIVEKSCESKRSDKTEMMWHHLDPSVIKTVCHVPRLKEVEQGLRLTLDYEEDYWLLKTMSRHLKFDCTRDDIVRFFEVNPGLRKINEFRNEDWKAGQKKQ